MKSQFLEIPQSVRATHPTGAQTATLRAQAAFVDEVRSHLNLASSGPSVTAPDDDPYTTNQEYYRSASVWFCFL